MTILHLDLLGGFECRAATGAPVVFPTRKIRALFAYLAACAGQRISREKLAGLLWGDREEARARADLRKSLSRLRESLPPEARGCILAEPGHLGLRPEGLEIDVLLFERLVADGTPETLQRAAGLYRGAFLETLSDCGEEFDAWLAAERRRLEEMLHPALQRLLDHYVVTGAIDCAIQIALRLLALDPLQENVHRSLIRLYMYQDRVGSALEQYRRCADALQRELGVEPSPETEHLKAELLRLVPKDARGQATAPARESDDLPERAAVLRTAAEDRARRRAELTGRPSIAVLAFADPQGHTSDGHLGAGLAEDVATELGRFRELDVIAPSTALAYAGVAPERVGAELGAAYVLEGRLRRLGDRLRVTVRLVQSESARQLWAERYDCALAGLFTLQDDLVRRIVGSLVGRIEQARLDVARRRPPEDLAAYDLWLRGWAALKRSDLAAIGEARRLFRQAVSIDPQFARAYLGLALAHLNEWACFSWNHWVFPKQEVLQFARRAVELDDRDHRAHCILGVAQLYAKDYEAARRQLLKALELNPNDADVLAHASFGLALIGERELSVETGRSALRLAPHHPEWYAAFAGIALFAARLHEEAIDTMAPAPEALCNTPAFIAASYAHLGHAEEGVRHKDTVYRHYRRQQARGLFPAGMSCVDWLLAMDPFRRPADVEHYVSGLRKAGFE